MLCLCYGLTQGRDCQKQNIPVYDIGFLIMSSSTSLSRNWSSSTCFDLFLNPKSKATPAAHKAEARAIGPAPPPEGPALFLARRGLPFLRGPLAT